MKIYIKQDDKYILLTDSVDKDNLENDYLKEELINNAMSQLETEKMKMEIKRENLNPVKMLKLGQHPDMKRSA